jgi:hypothetical protein
VPDGRLRVERPRRCADVRAPTPRDAIGRRATEWPRPAWCNTQVTYSPSPANARSESELEANPLNALNMVGASKRFTNPPPRTTQRWRRARRSTAASRGPRRRRWRYWVIPIPTGYGRGSRIGHRVGQPRELLSRHTAVPAAREAVPDARHRRLPVPRRRPHVECAELHPSQHRRRHAMGDRNPGGPYRHVYAAWDEGSSLAFARTIDQGATCAASARSRSAATWRRTRSHPRSP